MRSDSVKVTGFFDRIKNATDKEFDAVLLISPVNRRYITGFKSSAGFVVIRPDGTFFITDFRYFGAAKEKVNEAEVILQNKAYEQLNELFAGCKNILVEEQYLTVSDFERIKEKMPEYTLIPGASDVLGKLRAVKEYDELELIKAAQDITDRAFEYIVRFISDHLSKGITESDVALELEYFMRKNGADGIAFDTIAVSGAKSAMPHGVPENIPVSKGFLTMDFGAMYGGYCSDMTRTVSIGKPTEKMKDVYDTVLNAQLKALEFITAGKTGKETDAVARDYINSRGYEGKFGHSLGHSLGLEIHESPNFSPSNESIIPACSVLSVEPGVYLDGEFGVRIEDIVYITQNGCENLTKSTKELIIL